MSLLTKPLLDGLLLHLKARVPVDTGNLRDNGIQGVANVQPNLWLCQIGYPATGGYPATNEYAAITQYVNSSKGWINRAINDWWNESKPLIDNYIASGVDNDEIL